MNIRVYRSKTKKIETLDFEQYLCGVVPSEIGRNAPFEAMKAQAVASRTYALRHLIADRSKPYDMTDTTSNQAYHPEKATEQSTRAVKETDGLVMVYNGAPIGAWFSSSNGGRIKAAHEKWGGKALPYSVAKDDPYDTHGGGGHGVGMSQYGAMAMAEQGYSYREILGFYYNDAFEYKMIGEVFVRTLKKGSNGEDVVKLQKRLMELCYSLPNYGADGDFGNETVNAVKAFQREHKDANGKKLTVDGVVGSKTWAALFADGASSGETVTDKQPESDTEAPAFNRNLKFGSEGEDVRAVQKRLLALGYSLGSYGADGDFGNATKSAVRAFQSDNGLDADGIVGKQTWEALFGSEPEPTPEPVGDIPENIGATAAAAIRVDIGKVSDMRQRIVLTALGNAYDPDKPRDYPYSLYIRGGNLYNTDLSLNVIDAARIESGAKRQPEYYSGGSKEIMLAAVAKYPGGITGADCSGGIVGLLRHFGLVKNTFDAIANGLCDSGHSRKISKADLQPGDWVGLSGHIGLYVGGGYVVEWYGQNFGCQLTKLGTKRKAWDFVGKKYRTRAEWTRYRRPKYY